MSKNKKGVSPLIATVLIIGFTIVLAAVVMQWGGGFVRDLTQTQAEKAEAQTTCIEYDFEITGVTDSTITILNNVGKEVPAFLIQKIGASGDSTPLMQPTDFNDANKLSAYSSKTYTFSGGATIGENAEIRVIPYVDISGNKVGCGADMAEEYTYTYTAPAA